MNKSTLTPIQFHDDTIYSIEYDGEQFTPVRPIVENLGLDWKSQYAKLNKYKERFSVVKITTQLPKDKQNREVICIPVRKLPGFLATINPMKVGNKLRPKIVRYQNECDDVLWDYWTKGHAVNPRQTLTPEQQREIQKIVAERVSNWGPKAARKGYAAIYRSVKDEFKVGTYKDVPANQFDELVKFLKIQPAQPITRDEFEGYSPTVLDDFVQAIFKRCDGIAEDLARLNASPTATRNIIVELVCISSIVSATFPNQARWLRFAEKQR